MRNIYIFKNFTKILLNILKLKSDIEELKSDVVLNIHMQNVNDKNILY